MKIGMKEDMGIANKMALLVLGSRARCACNCSQSAPEPTYLLFMVARSEGLRIGVMDIMGIVDKMALLVLGSQRR